jgi:hypothetical protein
MGCGEAEFIGVLFFLDKSAHLCFAMVGDEFHRKGAMMEIQIVGTKEKKRFDRMLGQYHYLGESRPAGDFLRQVAVEDGHWVGLLAWGSACYKLKDRDEWIGWSATLRAERQKLVVQNRRFLLPGKKGHHPNLASRILGAAVRSLPAQWEEAFGYRPLLAETFTDIEQFKGTCYKAAGWEPVGMSRGFSRHRADFYVANDRPKKLWLKALDPRAQELLSSSELASCYQAGGSSSAHGVLPFGSSDVESLREALGRVADPRGRNRRFRISAVLPIVAMALLSGHRQLAQIHRFGQRLTQAQRRQLGLPLKKGTKFYQSPSYKVYYNLLRQMNLDELAKVLSEWLAAHEGSLPSCLAMDGKMVRDTVGVLTMANHQSGSPHAMAPMSMKEGQGDRCEIKSAQRLIEGMDDLSGKLITSDALHCQKRTARSILERGGDYLVQVKDNQKTVRQCVEDATAQPSPFLSSATKVMAASSGVK